MKPALSLVVCTLDEAEAIGGVLTEAARVFAGVPLEIIVVDDSADDATERAARAAPGDFALTVIRRGGAGGLASAAMAGWDAARANLLALMDGDGQHDPAVLRTLYDRVAAGEAELGVVSRYVDDVGTGLSHGRNLISRGGTALAQIALGGAVTDPLSGCFVMTRDWYRRARPKLTGVGFKILVDLLASASGPRVVEAAAALRPRAGGESKLDLRVAADLGALLVDKWTRGLIPARFVLFTAVGVTGVGVNLGVLFLQRVMAGEHLALGRFAWGQVLAVICAMFWNFTLNNALTFRDARLRGSAFWRGFVTFAIACSVGAVMNWGVSVSTYALGAPLPAAGLLGALLAGVWNFWAARRTTWKA